MAVRSARARLIAAQSLVTAILLGVIALTILNPGDGDDLFGVGVPGSPGVNAAPPPAEVRDLGEPAARQEGPAELAFTGPTAPAPRSIPVGATVETLGREDGRAGETRRKPPRRPDRKPPRRPDRKPPRPAPQPPPEPQPPGDQYGDTLTRLRDAID